MSHDLALLIGFIVIGLIVIAGLVWLDRRKHVSPTGRPLAAPHEYQRRWRECREVLKAVKNGAGQVYVGERDKDEFVRWCYDVRVP